MTKRGFWHTKILLLESGTSAKDFARTRSFCRLQIALTVNNFSSEKMISSMSVYAFNLLRRIFARSSLFSFWRSVRHRQVCILRDDNFKSVLTVFLIILSLTFISQAIPIMNLFGGGGGDAQCCGNYREIKLMSHTIKIWERIIEARL